MQQVKSYQCPMCGTAFANEDQLVRHTHQQHDTTGGSRFGRPTRAAQTSQYAAKRAMPAERVAPSEPRTRWMLPGVITVLALADGVLHFMLDYVLFHGNLWGAMRMGPPAGVAGSISGPAPGGPAPHVPPAPNPILRVLDVGHITGLPLNELFLLNFVGYIVLALVFWFGRRWLGRRRWLIDVAIIVYTAASIIGWLDANKPNPHGLGYLSKGIELLLIAALAVHAWLVLRERGAEVRRTPTPAGAWNARGAR